MLLEELYNSEEYTATIYARGSGRLRGLISNGIEISGSNQYETMFQDRGSSVSKLLNQIGAVAGSLAGKFVQFKLQHISQTIKLWLSGGLGSLNINLLVPNFRSGNFKEEINSFFQLTQPSKSGVSIIAPNGYSAVIGDHPRATGTVALRYSTYLNSTFVFVISNYSISFSDIIMENGTPSYATISITLEPYRMLTKEDIKVNPNGSIFIQDAGQ